ncbi:MAG: D-glycero-D-manno-heptose 1,7-bisphosphate phosphatase [Verrucomicrobiota bacterium]|jgi:D-glycero-D-manno-heptose 1,7-bisphosphate phosphatase
MGEHEVKRRAVFLDRDGVINKPIVREGRPYPPAEEKDFELYEDVAAGCARLEAAGYMLIVVTNQPDVARGTQTRAAVDAMHRKMLDALPQIARVEVCWHAGTDWGDSCDCHKPAPGMVLRAAQALGIDLAKSYLVGDRWRDVDCGHSAGCRTIFVDRNYAEALRQPPDWTVKSFGQAVEVIMQAGAAATSR